MIVENPGREFEASVQRRAEAEKAHAEWQAKQRLVRASNSRSKPLCDYQPGELVYFCKSQEAGKSRKAPGNRHGRFIGPARILAVESKRQPDGSLLPGSAVWCVRGRSLVKCCPEQLRRASPREELLESLTDQSQAPWTFNRVARELGGTQYEDLSLERPADEEWNRAQDVEQEIPPVRHRVTRKRPLPVATERTPIDPDEELIPDDQMGTSSSSRDLRFRSEQRDQGAFAGSGSRWYENVTESAWTAEDTSYWADELAAVSVEIEMPRDCKGWEKAMGSFEVYS